MSDSNQKLIKVFSKKLNKLTNWKDVQKLLVKFGKDNSIAIPIYELVYNHLDSLIKNFSEENQTKIWEETEFMTFNHS